MSDKIIFHLMRLWEIKSETTWKIEGKIVDLYEEIKSGRKTSEWRGASEYWARILTGEPRSSHDYAYGDTHNLTGLLEARKAWFVVGYPKNNLPRLEADIVGLIFHRNSDQFEVKIANVKEITK